MRAISNIGLARGLFLLLVVAEFEERTACCLVLAGGFLDGGTNLERGLHRLRIAAHRLAGFEMDAATALPDRDRDTVGHPLACFIRQPVRWHQDQDPMWQPSALGFGYEL